MRTLGFFLFVLTIMTLIIINASEIKNSNKQQPTVQEINAMAAGKQELARINADERVQIALIQKDSAVGVARQNMITTTVAGGITAGTVLINVLGGLIAVLAFLYVFSDSLKRYIIHREKMQKIDTSYKIQNKQLAIAEAGIRLYGRQQWEEVLRYACIKGYTPKLQEGTLYLVNKQEQIELLPE